MMNLFSNDILPANALTAFALFGSYFPSWVARLMLGLLFVTFCHVALRQTGMLPAMPLLPVFYLMACLFAGSTSWLVFFSQG